jgi:hypothetical protein
MLRNKGISAEKEKLRKEEDVVFPNAVTVRFLSFFIKVVVRNREKRESDKRKVDKIRKKNMIDQSLGIAKGWKKTLYKIVGVVVVKLVGKRL